MQEHCLMGIKGTVKRSTDGDFIHANVDIDLIIEEEPEFGSKDKPVEIFHIVEHFCLGRRRLHLFGRDSTIRPGWLTLGSGLTSSNFDPEVRVCSWLCVCVTSACMTTAENNVYLATACFFARDASLFFFTILVAIYLFRGCFYF